MRLKRTEYFWSMTNTLKDVMLFRLEEGETIWFSIFCWVLFPVPLGSWIGWLIADLFLSDDY